MRIRFLLPNTACRPSSARTSARTCPLSAVQTFSKDSVYVMRRGSPASVVPEIWLDRARFYLRLGDSTGDVEWERQVDEPLEHRDRVSAGMGVQLVAHGDKGDEAPALRVRGRDRDAGRRVERGPRDRVGMNLRVALTAS
jgi:hypothetical protein